MSMSSGAVLSECYDQEYVQHPITTQYTLSTKTKLCIISPVQIVAKHTKQELDDEELMAGICLSEEWAMEALYQRYYKYIYAMAYRIVCDRVMADDIVQEVFLAVWRKATSYQQLHGSVRTWLVAIVRHRAIDCVRSAMSRNCQSVPLQETLEQDPLSKESEPWEAAWHRERTTMLHQILAQLPVNQRQAIELRYFDGSTDVEIADYLHIPLGTVKGRIRLGLQKMKQLLYGYDMG